MKIEDLRIGQYVYHKDLYWGRERMKIVGLREFEVELEGDWSGGTNPCNGGFGRSWMSIDGIILNN